MKKYQFLIILGVAISASATAQQTIRFSNYLFNKMILNPAAAGSNEYIEFMGSYRKQWTGFNGSPRTSFLSVDGSAFARRLGLGLQVVNDKVGALDQTGVIGNVAGRVRLSTNGYLAVGVSTGFFRNSLNGQELTYKDQDETVIPGARSSIGLVDFKAGVYYKDLRNFAGVSVFNILEPKLNYTDRPSNQANLDRHYYFLLGRVFPIGDKFGFVPSLMYKMTNSGRDQLDINARIAYQNQFSFGVSYRNKESIVAMAEYIFNNTLRFGYAFDYNTNELNNYNNGSHEIMVAYRIIQNKEIIENPRYFYNN